MNYCKYCGTENTEDSLYCKKCGNSFTQGQGVKEKEKKQNYKTKTRVKTKVKTKTKKVKAKHDKVSKEKNKSSFVKKFLIFLLFLLTIVFGTITVILGFYYYQSKNISVPDVVGLSYDSGYLELENQNLNVERVEKKTTSQEEDGQILKQSKKAFSKVSEGTKIRLTVGVYEQELIVPKVLNMPLKEAIILLDAAKVKYQIIYQGSDEENDIILKQSISAGKKVSINTILTLTISNHPDTEIDSSKNTETEEKNNTD